MDPLLLKGDVSTRNRTTMFVRYINYLRRPLCGLPY